MFHYSSLLLAGTIPALLTATPWGTWVIRGDATHNGTCRMPISQQIMDNPCANPDLDKHISNRYTRDMRITAADDLLLLESSLLLSGWTWFWSDVNEISQ
jgi:hypothetical protein